MDMQQFRKKYPQYDDWTDKQIITAINKKHGAKAKKAEPVNDEQSGWEGIANEAGKSLLNTPKAAWDMVKGIPAGAIAALREGLQNPAAANLSIPAGMIEGATGLINAKPNVAQYLANKGIVSKDTANNMFRMPSIKPAAEMAGVGGTKGTDFIKMLSSFMAPGALAKGFGGGALATGGAAGALAAGENQDPLQAALLTGLSHIAASKGANAIKRIPQSVNRAAGVPPPPPPGGGAGGAPIASLSTPSTSALPINGAPVSPLPIQPATPAPSGVAWNAQPPSSVSWMQNIPQAALNVAASVPKKAKKIATKIPEVAGTAAASGLEALADAGSKMHIPGSQPILGALASKLKHLSLPPEEMAKRKLFGDITSSDLPRMIERDAAAKRLDLSFLTPAELALSTFEAEKQGTIGRTSAGSQELYKKGAERTQSEINASSKFLDSIYDDAELDPQVKSAYEATMLGRVPHSFIVEHSKLPVVQEAMKKLQNDSAYRQIIERELGVPLDTVNPKTFRYWDIIKRVLYDMEEDKKSKLGKATTRSDEIGKTRRKLVDQMDIIKPEYAEARNISERKFTRGMLEHYFDKRPMTLNNWHKYLSSGMKFRELQNKLKGLPEATQMLHDIHLLGGDLIPNEMNIRTAAKLKRTGMTTPRNKLDAMKQALDEEYGQEHDVEAVKQMTHPELLRLISEYLTEKGK